MKKKAKTRKAIWHEKEKLFQLGTYGNGQPPAWMQQPQVVAIGLPQPGIPQPQMQLQQRPRKIPYGGHVGHFAAIGRWFHCRDIFQRDCGGVPGFYFVTKHPDKTVAFIQVIEEKLGLKAKSRLVFQKTNFAHCIYVKMSKWWRSSHRRSFLTMALRRGGSYRIKANNWRKALYGSKYLTRKGTLKAARRFMDGAVAFRGKFNGWVRVFRDENNVTKLTYPKKKK